MNEERNIDQQNQDAYDDLVVSIEASVARLNILIAVCDDLEFRDEIIKGLKENLVKPNQSIPEYQN